METDKKRKKTIQIISSTLCVILIGGAIGLGTFAILKFTNNFNSNNSNIPSNAIEVLKPNASYIRERSFSLRFYNSKTSTATYGTTWIFKKSDEVDSFKYYLATNMHVIAGFVQNDNTSSSNLKYKLDQSSFTDISLGYPNDPATVYEKNDLAVETFSKTNPYIPYVGTSFPVKLIYTASKNNSDPNSYKYIPDSTNNYYKNIMSDLAILEFDFSNSSSGIKNFLTNYYDKNPTKFFSGSLDKNNYKNYAYYIGGYPFIKKMPINNLNQSSIGTWKYGSSVDNDLAIKTNITSGTIIASEPNNSDPLKRKLGLEFPTTSNTYFQNISSQITIPGVNLEGGSSGSMVVNQYKELVGIYWGVYSSSNNNYKYGSFDIFNTPSYKSVNTSYTYPAYNRFEEINQAINNK